MRTNKLIASIITMMIVFSMYSQSAAAFERVADACDACHKQVVDKVADVDLKVTGAVEAERQTASAVISASMAGTESRINQSVVISDYRTGFKSRPGWQA